MRDVASLTEDESDAASFLGRDRQLDLKGAARVESGTAPAAQLRGAETTRLRHGPITADELGPVARIRTRTPGRVQERHVSPELRVVDVARENRAAVLINLSCHKSAFTGTTGTKAP